MSRIIRAAVLVSAFALWGLYLQSALSSDASGDPLRWTNQWMRPAIFSITAVIVVFVLTLKRAGTRGSVVTNLTDMLKRTPIKDPVEGAAQVVSASAPPRSGQNAGRAMCEMNLVVTVPGKPSVAVDTAALAPLAKWPTPGMVLPVLAERTDPRQFKIMWKQVSEGWDVGVKQAQQLADQMNRTSGGSTTGSTTNRSRTFATNVTINGQPANAEDLAPFEEMAGMDLNGDGVIGGAGDSSHSNSGPTVIPLTGDAAKTLLGQLFGGQPDATADGSSSPSDDPVSRLERLAALRASGSITNAEYEAAKKTVLGN